jgi:Photosynthetic reaction centre cytochrome C subunit/Tetratricopeptide repeat
MRRARTGLIAVGFIVFLAASSALAQGASPAGAQPPAPPPLTNLQVYPKDIARPELIATMQGFVQQLGVQSQGGCAFCHTGSGPQADYASDGNPKKNVARRMILMAREISAKLPDVTGKPAAEISRLRCATCHRGQAVPKVTVDALTETTAKSGVTAAVEQYRDLRKQAIDFNDNSLVTYANALTNANKPDDALTLLQANAELSPNSAPTYGAMAQAYGKKNDTANQIKMLEKAVQLDPNNQLLKRQLDQLKANK